jgi:AGZA family xanthine/uracil permease-like MFS transporter
MVGWLERQFGLTGAGTTWQREVGAGTTTFLTMAYIIFLQPAILSGALFGFSTGMDAGAVLTATCLAAALGSLLMGLLANYPVGLAPGMGLNFMFTLTLIPAAAATGAETPWKVALGVVLISGILFVILTFLRVRELILRALTDSLKNAIAVGIGLFIAFVGLQNSGLVLKDPGTAVTFNHRIYSPDLLIFFFGLFLTGAMMVRGIRGAVLWGIVASTFVAVIAKEALAGSETTIIAESALMTRFTVAGGLVTAPPSIMPTLMQADLVGALAAPLIPFIIIFLFMDMFDTMGTLIGVSTQAGLMRDGKLPRLTQAFAADALATAGGAALGTSTVTSYIESTAGVEYGGRTGLTACVVAGLFLLALFFEPVVQMVGSYAAITAPALVIVGSMMARNVVHIAWSDPAEALPAFLVLIGIPLSYSISDGIALGIISSVAIRLLGGRRREVDWMGYVLAGLMVAYFVLVRSRLG